MLIVKNKTFFCLILIALAVIVSFGVSTGAQESNTGIREGGVAR